MTAPLTYSIDQAAERLGPIVTVSWLKHNIGKLPHRKSGAGRGRAGRVAFTEADLAEILQLLERRPPGTAPLRDPDEWGIKSKRRSA